MWTDVPCVSATCKSPVLTRAGAKSAEEVSDDYLEEVVPKIVLASWNYEALANVHPYLCHDSVDTDPSAVIRSAKKVGVQDSSKTKLSANAMPFVGFTTYLDGGAPFGIDDFNAAELFEPTIAAPFTNELPLPFMNENDELANVPVLGRMAREHDAGECKPCAYFLLKEDGCRWGMECEFCHLCPADELKKRKKEKIAALKQETQAAGTKAKNPIWFVRRRQVKKAKSEAP